MLAKYETTARKRDAALKEWAKSHARDCLRKAARLEKENLFSDEAAQLHSSAIQVLRSAGLSLASIHRQ